MSKFVPVKERERESKDFDEPAQLIAESILQAKFSRKYKSDEHMRGQKELLVPCLSPIQGCALLCTRVFVFTKWVSRMYNFSILVSGLLSCVVVFYLVGSN